MKEEIRLRLNRLYDKEINESRIAASNEHLWAIGSEGKDAVMHEDNAEELREYISILELLKEMI